MANELPDLHVLVKFGKGIPSSVQGPTLLAFERHIRSLMQSTKVEVMKEHKGDDSQLRSALTSEQRARL